MRENEYSELLSQALNETMAPVQSIVNEAFMERLVKYSQSAKQLYKIYPLVMVFCIDKLSLLTLITKFIPVDGKPWMQRILCCDFWAKKCYLVSKSSLSCEEVDANISPLQALSMVLIEQSPTLYGHSLPEHSTVQTLYRLVMECTAYEAEQREDLAHVVGVICSNNKKFAEGHDALNVEFARCADDTKYGEDRRKILRESKNNGDYVYRAACVKKKLKKELKSLGIQIADNEGEITKTRLEDESFRSESASRLVRALRRSKEKCCTHQQHP
ncbi:hypothetical protein CU097_002595, partial [Rhizopus azygosporus]